MPKIPFLPLAVNDIDTATWRFELAERGAYDIILNELWRHKGQGIPNDDKWVADLLKIKPNTLRKQRSVGKNFIPYHKIGGSVRYNKLEVQEYLDNRLRRSAND